MQTKMNHHLWLDSLNYHQTQGRTLAQALTLAEQWPFPTINGQQTPQSKALQSNKALHKPTPKDLTDIEEALL